MTSSRCGYHMGNFSLTSCRVCSHLEYLPLGMGCSSSSLLMPAVASNDFIQVVNRGRHTAALLVSLYNTVSTIRLPVQTYIIDAYTKHAGLLDEGQVQAYWTLTNCETAPKLMQSSAGRAQDRPLGLLQPACTVMQLTLTSTQHTMQAESD